MSTAKRIFITAAAVVLLCAAGVTAVFAAPAGVNAITSVTINKNKDAIAITATLSDTYVRERRGKSIYLFELSPELDGSDIDAGTMSFSPVDEAKISQNLSFSLPFDPSDTACLLSKYVLAESTSDGAYHVLTDEYYITNINSLAPFSYSYPAAASKKGLEVQLLSDAQELGVSYAVINVSIGSLLQGESSTDTISYIFSGKTYYISRPKLDSLDHRIKTLSDSGVIVYLNIILSAPEASSNASDKLKALYYPAALENPGARLYAVNTDNADSVRYYAGLLNFLAKRYTDPKGETGFAGGWIIGYEVNSNRNFNFMGPADVKEYAASYVKALRIADTMLRSVYSNGRVYVSVANNFNNASQELNFAGDDKLDYAARLFLERMSQSISLSGDIPWNLSINPYPSDPANTAYWTDTNTLNSLDTPFITMKNIGVITDFMGQENLLYKSTKRRVLVGSFGVSGESATSGEALQAAAFANAYYTVACNDDIEALIWHRHVDSADESGLLLGLWTTAQGSTLTPAKKKNIYRVFKYIDTKNFVGKEQSQDLTEFALKLIDKDKNSWDSVIPGFDINKVVTRGVFETISYLESEIDSKYKQSTLFNFSGGELHDFMPTDNAKYVELRDDSYAAAESSAAGAAVTDKSAAQPKSGSILYAKLSPPSSVSGIPNVSGFEYMGVSKNFSEPLDISNTGYITLRVKTELPPDAPSADIMLRLLGHKKDNGQLIVYEGVSQVKSGEWNNVTFKLTDYAAQVGSVDTMKIWVKPYDDKAYEGDYGLMVQNVLLYAKSKANVLGIILWVILILFIAAVVGFFGLVARNQIQYRLRLRHQRQRAMQKELARRETTYPPSVKQLPPGQSPRSAPKNNGMTTGTARRVPPMSANPQGPHNQGQNNKSQQPTERNRPQARRRPPEK